MKITNYDVPCAISDEVLWVRKTRSHYVAGCPSRSMEHKMAVFSNSIGTTMRFDSPYADVPARRTTRHHGSSAPAAQPWRSFKIRTQQGRGMQWRSVSSSSSPPSSPSSESSLQIVLIQNHSTEIKHGRVWYQVYGVVSFILLPSPLWHRAVWLAGG